MEDVRDVDACRAHCPNRIFIVQLFAGSGQSSKSAWPQIATCPKSEVRARLLLLHEIPIENIELFDGTGGALLRVHPLVRTGQLVGHIQKGQMKRLAVGGATMFG